MDVLPDVLGPHLKVVFCGSAVGKQSAERRAYYAGDGNKFWSTLCSIGLIDRLLEPHEYQELLKYRIGLTDLAKNVSGSDSVLRPTDFDRDRLRKSVLSHNPFALAFTSKKAGETFFDKKISWGQQPKLLGTTRVYVLPSTSGLANAHWNQGWWRQLAEDIKNA